MLKNAKTEGITTLKGKRVRERKREKERQGKK